MLITQRDITFKSTSMLVNMVTWQSKDKYDHLKFKCNTVSLFSSHFIVSSLNSSARSVRTWRYLANSFYLFYEI